MHSGDFDLPDWARWIATDADGAVWAYEVEPLLHDTGWYENEVGRRLLLGRQTPIDNWRESLKLKRKEPLGEVEIKRLLKDNKQS